MPVYFIVSFLASVIGAICGIGGGVIIKPTLDLFQISSVAAANFLSGCTVLAMSLYSVGRNFVSHDHSVDLKTGTPLAIGAAAGGWIGRQMFAFTETLTGSASTAGSLQAIILGLLTAGTLLYTLKKSSIPTKNIRGLLPCLVIGLALGVISSFLGIGGGPFNLVVLTYFFGMSTKIAAANSLYIILFSQAASLGTTIISHTVPSFSLPVLLLMISGGVSGGMVGRAVNRHLDDRAVDRLFIGLMIIILLICVYNFYQYR